MPTLADELVLIAITEKGDVASEAWTRLDNGVAGAHLMELAVQGRTVLEDEKISVVDSSPTGAEPTDQVLAERAVRARLRGLAEGDELRRALGAANEATMHAMMVAVLLATTAGVTAATTAAIVSN